MTDDKKRWNWPFGGPGSYTYKIDQSVKSYNQMGGITAHTVNLTPPDRTLNDNLRARMLQVLPKDRIIKVDAPMGDGEAIRFSQQIWDFLAGAGYTMHEGGLSQSVRMPPPRGQGFDLEGDPDVATVIIGHR